MSLYQYVTGSALVLFFICTGTVGTVGTLVPATQHWYQPLNIGTSHSTLVPSTPHWYQPPYIGTSHSMSMCLYVTGTTLVLLFICSGTLDTVDTLVLATLFPCTNMLLLLIFIFTVTVCTVGTLV